MTSTSLTNRALRVVNSEGANSGGNVSFTDTFKTRTVPLLQHSHNASAGNQSANHVHNVELTSNGAHDHEVNDPGHSHNYEDTRGDKSEQKYGDDGEPLFNKNEEIERNTEGTNTNITIEGVGGHEHEAAVGTNSANHKHTITIANAGTSGASMDFRVRYLDVIICSKNSY